VIPKLLFRPPGRPGHNPLVRYKGFSYQAGSRTEPKRIVAKVEHHKGELVARVSFIVSNLSMPSRTGNEPRETGNHARDVAHSGQMPGRLEARSRPNHPAEMPKEASLDVTVATMIRDRH